jgi:hypothetical protein
VGAKVVVTYEFGSLVRFTVRFTDPNRIDAPLDPDPPADELAHTLVDPTTITAIVKHPDGTTVTKVYGTDAEVVRDDVGTYHMDVSCATPGSWVLDWTGAGSLQAESQVAFKVGANLLAP